MRPQRLADPRRPIDQLAAAIGAKLVERIGAFGAESAFERADERAGLIGGQIDAAAFAIGAHFEHCLALGRSRGGAKRGAKAARSPRYWRYGYSASRSREKRFG